MTPTAHESAGQLWATIKRRCGRVTHTDEAAIMLAIVDHIKADRHTHVQHVARSATNLLPPTDTTHAATPITSRSVGGG